MSNGARFDSLLVRHLARELDRLLAGRTVRLRSMASGSHSVALEISPREVLHFDLHPATRGVRVLAAEGAAGAGHRLQVARVEAPLDERLLRLELRGGNRFSEELRTLVVELIPTRENAYELDGAGRIVQLLRGLRDPARRLAAGAAYVPPSPTGRLAPRNAGGEEHARLLSVWKQRLGPLASAERRSAYLAGFAFASPQNADWVLGGPAADEAAGSFGRWWELVHAPAQPVLLGAPGRPQPYPHPLGQERAEPLAGLLEGFARQGPAAGPEARPAPLADPGSIALAEKRLASAVRRRERLEAELQRSEGAGALRRDADLLLARLHLVERGARRVRLPDWEGGELEVELDPARSPAENAERLYAEARRLDRARDRLPRLIATAAEEVTRREGLLEAIRAGETAPAETPAAPRGRKAAPEDEGLPYRRYRTSGGLEVRVGRSARANDRLTFGHSDPKDVWLHARAVGGSHVVLRWPRDEAPPGRDLEEAAVLAALHSKARGSGVVAVDWTQRRHVRKPRGAPPGAVTPGRTRTVFVEPDPAVEERMRDEA